MNEAERIISILKLEPLRPEGGYFRRTWTSRELDPAGRPLATAIYFLLTSETFSALHRLDADELWHFHAGDPVEHLRLAPDGTGTNAVLGPRVVEGQLQQLAVPRGHWQGARIAPGPGKGWSLVGCTMAPGWHAGAFEAGKRGALTRAFPSWERLIASLTPR